MAAKLEICGFAAAGTFFVVEAALVEVAGGLAAGVTGFASVGAVGALLVVVFGTFDLLSNVVRVQRRTLLKAGEHTHRHHQKDYPRHS